LISVRGIALVLLTRHDPIAGDVVVLRLLRHVLWLVSRIAAAAAVGVRREFPLWSAVSWSSSAIRRCWATRPRIRRCASLTVDLFRGPESEVTRQLPLAANAERLEV